MNHNLPLLICSALTVDAPKTMLTNSAIRLDLLIKGIIEWRRINPSIPIVICDGSGYNLSPILKEHGLCKSKNIEAICFKNDKQCVRKLGKGFGEGQIVDKAIRESDLIAQAGGFLKCTSRLWVENFQNCMRFFNGVAGFDYQGLHQPSLIDTRFYAVRVSFYDRYLRNAHEEVDERNGLNLEHVFLRRLSSLTPRDYLFRVTPRIYGVSGSMGTVYKPSRTKNLFRSLRNSFACATGTFP